MHCPNCKAVLHCGCRTCVKNNPNRLGNMIREDNGEIIMCPFCQFRAHDDQWLDIEWEQYKFLESQKEKWAG